MAAAGGAPGPNEWTGLAGLPEILAAFVLPNDPAVAGYLRAAGGGQWKLEQTRVRVSGPTGEIGAMVLPAVLTTQQPEAKRQWYLKDHLGSICGVVTPGASAITRQLFDSWGRPRETSGANLLLPKAAPTSANYQFAQQPGYTGHEMLEQFGLIHMNGRIYDPILARFLSADPVIADAGDIQAYNRYSYVGNSPLNYTDPTGYTKSELAAQSSGGSSLGIILAIMAIVVAVVLQQYWIMPMINAAEGALTIAALAASAATGAISGFIASGFSLEGALWGAISGAVFAYIGHGVQWADVAQKTGQTMADQARYLAHGLAAGALSTAQGGKFGSGFAAAYVSAQANGLLDPHLNEIENATARNIMKVGAAAIVGGTASSLGGGKFANGAITGAFREIFNEFLQQPEEGAMSPQVTPNPINKVELKINVTINEIREDRPGEPDAEGANLAITAVNEVAVTEARYWAKDGRISLTLDVRIDVKLDISLTGEDLSVIRMLEYEHVEDAKVYLNGGYRRVLIANLLGKSASQYQDVIIRFGPGYVDKIGLKSTGEFWDKSGFHRYNTKTNRLLYEGEEGPSEQEIEAHRSQLRY